MKPICQFYIMIILAPSAFLLAQDSPVYNRVTLPDAKRYFKLEINNIQCYDPSIYHSNFKVKLGFILNISRQQLSALDGTEINFYYKDREVDLIEAKTRYEDHGILNDSRFSEEQTFHGTFNIPQRFKENLKFDINGGFSLRISNDTFDIDIKIYYAYEPSHLLAKNGNKVFLSKYGISFTNPEKIKNVLLIPDNLFIEDSLVKINNIEKTIFHHNGILVLSGNTDQEIPKDIEPWGIVNCLETDKETYYFFYTLENSFTYKDTITIAEFPILCFENKSEPSFNGRLPFSIKDSEKIYFFHWDLIEFNFYPFGISAFWNQLGTNGFPFQISKSELYDLLFCIPKINANPFLTFDTLEINIDHINHRTLIDENISIVYDLTENKIIQDSIFLKNFIDKVSYASTIKISFDLQVLDVKLNSMVNIEIPEGYYNRAKILFHRIEKFMDKNFYNLQ